VGVSQISTAIVEYRALGAQWNMPFFLALLAEANVAVGDRESAVDVLAEALALVDKTEERWWEAEIHRIKGELLRVRPRPDGVAAEAEFERALEIARRQGVKSLELRASTSFALHLAERGERHEAQNLLAPIYGGFTEGFDTPDLVDAKKLLDALK